MTRPVSPRLPQAGLTLIELVVFIVIVSIGVAGILLVMNTTVKSSADPMLRKQAAAMADAVMEEVLAKDYANPPGGFTETDFTNCSGRQQYDDVFDYNCFDGNPATAVINGAATLGSTSIAALAAYNATVNVQAVTINGATMAQVTVNVSGGPESIQLVGYRGNY